MLVCEYLTSRLKREGVKVVFGYTGGNIVYCIDAVQRADGIDFIENRHEEDSAFAANGVAAQTGHIACAMVSSGPGALNLVTGIANAWYDSLPVLFIAGDVSRYQGKTLARQDAFQATPIVRAAAPFCKFAAEIRSLDGIEQIFDRAFSELTNGRHGPVLLSIAHFIQRSSWPSGPPAIDPAGFDPCQTKPGIASADLSEISRILFCSKAPLVLIGGGMKADAETLDLLLKRCSIPFAVSLRGASFLDQKLPTFLGLVGDYGHKAANAALAACDCLIALGTRLDERQTWALKKYNPTCRIIHLDIDPDELFEQSDTYYPVHAAGSELFGLLEKHDWNAGVFSAWKTKLDRLRSFFPRIPSGHPLHELISRIGSLMPEKTSFFVDVGMNQMLSAQSLELHAGQRFFTSSGLGSMGFAIPAAAGASAAIRAEGKKELVVAITGDGGFQMSFNDLITVRKEHLPLKILVINNSCLGMIRGLQDHIMEGRLTASVDGYSVCDIEKIASAFDIRYHRVDLLSADPRSLQDILLDPGSPALFEIRCAYEDSIPYPNGPCDLEQPD